MNRATGLSHGCLALAGGAQRWGGRATGRFRAARLDKAPSISYMEGALLHSARHRGFCRDDTLANLGVPICSGAHLRVVARHRCSAGPVIPGPTARLGCSDTFPPDRFPSAPLRPPVPVTPPPTRPGHPRAGPSSYRWSIGPVRCGPMFRRYGPVIWRHRPVCRF
jgi:hypothetical protein